MEDVSFEILRKCPNNCLHCSSCSNFSCEEIFSLKKICQIVDELAELNVKRICLSGGEPFLHPDIYSIVSHIASKEIICDIYTSGIIRDSSGYSSIPLEMLRQLKTKGLHRLMFNFQSTSESNYNTIMGTTGCYGHLLETIKNSVQCNIETELHFVPMKLNWHEVENVIDFAQDNGILRVSFLKLVEHGRAKNNKLALNACEEKKLKTLLNNLKKSNPIVRVGIPLNNDCQSCLCHAVRDKLYIKYDGCVYGCEAFKYIDFPDTTPSNVNDSRIKDILSFSPYICKSKNLIWEHSASSGACPVQNYLSSKEE